jgi:hypothetical protein
MHFHLVCFKVRVRPSRIPSESAARPKGLIWQTPGEGVGGRVVVLQAALQLKRASAPGRCGSVPRCRSVLLCCSVPAVRDGALCGCIALCPSVLRWTQWGTADGGWPCAVSVRCHVSRCDAGPVGACRACSQPLLCVDADALNSAGFCLDSAAHHAVSIGALRRRYV